MRLSKVTAGLFATGALLFAAPAVASASTSSASPSATPSSFAQVADGQTVAQVEQEMGSAGAVQYFEPGTTGVDNTTEVLGWNDSALGALGGNLQFRVTFMAPVGQPLTVSSKTALGVG